MVELKSPVVLADKSLKCNLAFLIGAELYLHFFDKVTRSVDAGYFLSSFSGRIGRLTKFPPQFGQILLSLVSTQFRQNVHSNEQIIA